MLEYIIIKGNPPVNPPVVSLKVRCCNAVMDVIKSETERIITVSIMIAKWGKVFFKRSFIERKDSA